MRACRLRCLSHDGDAGAALQILKACRTALHLVSGLLIIERFFPQTWTALKAACPICT
jgi:hypothetical protein